MDHTVSRQDPIECYFGHDNKPVGSTIRGQWATVSLSSRILLHGVRNVIEIGSAEVVFSYGFGTFGLKIVHLLTSYWYNVGEYRLSVSAVRIKYLT